MNETAKNRIIRFSQLVKQYGAPERVTLWASAAENKPLMRAVKENRVLTIFQKPVGSQKDHAQIGFHREPFVTYLIFPQELPEDSSTRIVGVDYGLIGDPKIKNPAQPARPPKAVTKPKPVLHEYEIQVTRIAHVQTQFTITASNETEARRQALSELEKTAFELKAADVRDEVKAVKRIA